MSGKLPTAAPSTAPGRPATGHPAAGHPVPAGQGKPGLLLVAHGSAHDPAAQAGAEVTLARHVEALRRTGLFGAVGHGFLKGEPSAGAALRAMDAREILVLPYMMSRGYLTRVALPRALGLPEGVAPEAGEIFPLAGRRLRFLPPLGSHPGLARVGRQRLLRASDAIAPTPAAVGVLVVGHGTPRARESGDATRQLAAFLRQTGEFAEVTAAFLEEQPLVAEALRGMTSRAILVLGFFAADGLHGGRDVPELLAAAAGPSDAGRPEAGPAVHYVGSLGADPAVPALIVEMARVGLSMP